MPTAAALSSKIWCDEDNHRKFEDYADFNEWLESDDGIEQRIAAQIDGLTQPSKAFFAGDRDAYLLLLESYRIDRRNHWLSKLTLADLCKDEHWSERNVTRFDQLCVRIESRDVVPFVGAGLSQTGGFPTWRNHLRQQGRTSGISPNVLEDLLARGLYEDLIDQIEQQHGIDVFAQELRDVFGLNGVIPETGYLLAELFNDTVITTNYDRLIEQSFDLGGGNAIDILTPVNILQPPDPTKITIVKLHGDIRTPSSCILSKSQYDQAYGAGSVDLSLPIPQALDYYFCNSSLLFLGCSLNQDRTIRVFEAIKAQAKFRGLQLPQHFAIEQCPASETALVSRNEYLLRLGITPIWFPAGEFDFVAGLLRLARNELKYRRN